MWNVLIWYSLELRVPCSIHQIGLLANVLRIASWLSVSGARTFLAVIDTHGHDAVWSDRWAEVLDRHDPARAATERSHGTPDPS